MALSVVLADDHRIVREGLRALLTLEPTVRLVGERRPTVWKRSDWWSGCIPMCWFWI